MRPARTSPGIAVVCALVLGCSDRDPGHEPDAGTPDASTDAEVARDAEAPSDAAVDAEVAPTCAAPATELLALDPAGPDTQIYAALVADDEGVWVAYCRPEDSGSGGFDVLVTRLGCDGVVQMEPVVVSGPGNDIGPHMARAADHLAIVWSRDDGSGVDNMDIVLRLVGTDGVPIGDEPIVLETTRNGEPVTGNALNPAIAARGDGFVIAGARSGGELTTFQAFAQSIDRDGALVGEAVDAQAEPGVTQDQVTVAVGGDDRAWIAWTRDDIQTRHVWFRELADGAAPELAFEDLEGSEAPVLAVDPSDPARVWLAATADRRVRVDVMLTDVGQPAGARPTLVLGDSRDLEHTPALAPVAGGGALLMHRVISGIRNEVVLHRFRVDGDGLAADDEVSLAREDFAGPYPFGLATVADDVWVAAWSDGTSPAFRLRGRFIVLP